MLVKIIIDAENIVVQLALLLRLFIFDVIFCLNINLVKFGFFGSNFPLSIFNLKKNNSVKQFLLIFFFFVLQDFLSLIKFYIRIVQIFINYLHVQKCR